MKIDASAARILAGRPASPGFASGSVVVVKADRGIIGQRGSDGDETERLKAAVARAVSDVAALISTTHGEAVDMLAFQIAMLEDDALIEPALAHVAEGKSAGDAFDACMQDEIAGYEASEDEYFRARASDLADIRDRVLDVLSGNAQATLPNGCLLLADDLTPSRFLSADWTGGAILLRKGSPTSHVAMLARARSVPMIVGLSGSLAEGDEVLVDAARGSVIVSPDAVDRQRFVELASAARRNAHAAEAYLHAPAITTDGVAIGILLNIASPDDLNSLDPAICDGIGLVRTELLFEGRSLPDEDTQYAVYRRIVDWAGGRPVTVRTLDAGGDKPIAGLTQEGESNPFLGVRGVRLSLLHRDLFRTQLAALCRAAFHGPIEVMIPMVAVPRELEATRLLLDEAVSGLARAGLPHRRPSLGMMVEVPSAAIAPDLFDADFYSIGSNDLTQYVMAAGRDIAAVAELARADDPAVLRLLANVVEHGRKSGRKVSLCGDSGGDPALIPALLRAGLRHLSMAPAQVARAKMTICQMSLGAT